MRGKNALLFAPAIFHLRFRGTGCTEKSVLRDTAGDRGEIPFRLLKKDAAFFAKQTKIMF
jgi:hypothetical protein